MINKFQTGGQVGEANQQLQQIFQIAKAAVQGDEQSMQMMAKIAQQVGGPKGLQQLAQYAQQMGDQEGAQALAAIADSMTRSARYGAKLNYLKKINNTCPEGTQLTYYKVGGQICSKCEAMAKQKTVNVMDAIKAEMFQGGGKTVAKKTPAKKQLDQAGRDSIAVNKYNDIEVQNLRPGDYKSTKDGIVWVPDRTKAPYKKEKKEKKENGGNITSKACPKCGKVHAGKCGSKLMKKKKKCACGTKLDAKKCGGKTVSKKKPMDKCGAKLKEMKCGSKMKKAKKHEFGGILEAMQKFAKGGSLNGVPFRN